ncbi:MAG: 2'-5' RNA ligase, partial [uncultured Solirubrobacteraceae bacterium]
AAVRRTGPSVAGAHGACRLGRRGSAAGRAPGGAGQPPRDARVPRFARRGRRAGRRPPAVRARAKARAAADRRRAVAPTTPPGCADGRAARGRRAVGAAGRSRRGAAQRDRLRARGAPVQAAHHGRPRPARDADRHPGRAASARARTDVPGACGHALPIAYERRRCAVRAAGARRAAL